MAILDRLAEWLSTLDFPAVRAELEKLEEVERALAQEIEARQRELAEVRASIAKVRPFVAVLETLAPESHPANDDEPSAVRIVETPLPSQAGRPSGRKVIRKVINEMPDVVEWGPAKMTEELQRRGVKTNAAAVQTNLSRMESDGELERVRKGAYRVPRNASSGTPDDAAETSADGQERLLAGDGGEA